MRTHLTLLQGALALLLVVTGCLFAVGSTIERHHRHHESTTTKSSETTGVNRSHSASSPWSRRSCSLQRSGYDQPTLSLSLSLLSGWCSQPGMVASSRISSTIRTAGWPPSQRCWACQGYAFKG